MDANSQKGGNDARKTAAAKDIPVRRPSILKNQSTATSPGEENPSAGEGQQSNNSDGIGPGFTHQVTNYPGGWTYDTINGMNPTSTQLPQIHQTPGFARPPHLSMPTSGAYLHNTNSPPIPNFAPQPNNFIINPPQVWAHNPLLIPFPHYHVSTLPTMADYGNGFMPNTGQHFQPPVPDTTYGGFVHTYTPRFDNGATTGIHAQPVSIPMMNAQPQGPPQHVYVAQGGQAIHTMPGQQFVGQPGVPMPGGQPQMIIGNGAPGMPVSTNPFPDVMGVGKTAAEVAAEQFNPTLNPEINEPQEMKPADDNPARIYMVRELDGNWIKHNRYTIDHGPFRWYVTGNGVFYAVRLEE
ncbi:uncharacterized protein BCR38DRAFT_486301 [Pseudomassariella vexata]|uniref:Uncharacterized protein n=1 Tax=Pseudomassariella vexata TaxID=1141098 RepID=A0A1Y2DWB9_9PEZI|nr:uncharacterized protein BCR38DRAFT_486301 [Pseudomassariella vexata]ORY63568.1 hypothetical protein BCR38DRAFT_486301 [Pseudomassariella vexata]